MTAAGATNAAELDELMGLLERIVPDPAGYGHRLIQQAVLQWAETGQRLPTTGTGKDGRGRLADLVLHLDDVNDEPAAPFGDPAGTTEAHPGPAEIQTVLACALGACDCWGSRSDCAVCDGAGSPGWADPDPDLFQRYVGPAAARLSVIWRDPSDDATTSRSESRPNHDKE